MEIIIFLLLLQLKHWYCDFFQQTYEQTVTKGIYGNPIGITHTLDHVTGSLVALTIFSVFFPIPVWSILIAVALEGLAHYHIDWYKVHYGCKDITKKKYWAEFGADQFAHQLCYILMAIFLLVS